MFFVSGVTGKPFFPGLDDQPGTVLLEEPGHLVDGSLGGAQPLSSPSRSSPHSQGSEGGERFSRKVFVGGLPPDIDEDEITASFRRFGPLVVDWPHKAESKSYFPPKGYAFLLFQVRPTQSYTQIVRKYLIDPRRQTNPQVAHAGI